MAKILDNNLNNDQILKESLSNNSLNQEVINHSSEKGIISTLGQLLPFAPMLLEQFTGQKISQPTGTIAEIQNTLQQIIANQQQIFTKIALLENNSAQRLLNLDKRLQSFSLTHEREKKQIEYNANNDQEEN